jgi:hypothetical protein
MRRDIIPNATDFGFHGTTSLGVTIVVVAATNPSGDFGGYA